MNYYLKYFSDLYELKNFMNNRKYNFEILQEKNILFNIIRFS